MARETSGGIRLTNTFKIDKAAPIDDRLTVTNVSDLYNSYTETTCYEGMEVYVSSTQDFYTLTDILDLNSSGGWEIKRGGSGGGDMFKSTYDPQNVSGDAFDRTNHTGTQTASTISDFDTEVSNNTDVQNNTSKNSYPSGDATKVGFISVTQNVDLDVLETDVSTNTSKVSADGSVTTHSDINSAGSGDVITATERNKLTNVNDNSTTGRAITDLDFNNHENITNNSQIYSFDGVSNGFMMTFSTITGVTSTLTKTGEPSRVLEENSYYLVTYFNNVFKISPE